MYCKNYWFYWFYLYCFVNISSMYSIPSHPIPSIPINLCPIFSYSTPSYPTLSHSILLLPFPLYPTLSHSTLFLSSHVFKCSFIVHFNFHLSSTSHFSSAVESFPNSQSFTFLFDHFSSSSSLCPSHNLFISLLPLLIWILSLNTNFSLFFVICILGNWWRDV